ASTNRFTQRGNGMSGSEANRKLVLVTATDHGGLMGYSLTQITRSGLTKTSMPSTSSNITKSTLPPSADS
ncbi:MAG: hypothetical protein ACXVJL_14850, partial [Candidatus Angelobacter sp.]